MMGSMKRDVPSRLIGDLTFLDVSKCCARVRSFACRSAPLSSMALICHSTLMLCWPRNIPVALLPAGASTSIYGNCQRWPLALRVNTTGLAGTLSLSIQTMTAFMRDLGREIRRSLPARNVAIINGHGGNRGILEAMAQELRADFGLNICVLHPTTWPELDAKAEVPEVHGGKNETSMMLALVPNLVRRER